MAPILEQIAQCKDNDRIIIERRFTDKSSGTTSFTAGELKREMKLDRPKVLPLQPMQWVKWGLPSQYRDDFMEPKWS